VSATPTVMQEQLWILAGIYTMAFCAS